ncbi:MAG: efflux RND transporter permease subunit [Acidobacteria bacterium]|nr:efflux RND transporter permease subunit [Acidobacteriota bacterium]
MIAKVIAACAENRLLTVLVVAFAAGFGVWALVNTPLDAIPDISDVQVIVHTSWPGRSPDLIEDQITYPIVTSLLAAPRVRVVRGQSMFGDSFVYAIFEDGTDMYWARSRVLEYMNEVAGQLPEGVTPRLGPDATAIGWVFEYALVDRSGRHSLADLRSFQDWHLRYWLESVPGVAEVAAVGGFVRQYQVDIDPNKLLGYGIPLRRVVERIKESNNDVGGKVIEYSGFEYIVRGRGYIEKIEDLGKVAIGLGEDGTPVRVSDVATVHFGPDIRRGLAELDGEGEVVGGIVIARYGANALDVIERVKRRIEEVRPGFPEGVELVVTYDRSHLIHRAVDLLRETLLMEGIIVAAVILLFLLHVRSALVAILILPVAVLLSFIPMYRLGITANIMSLGGIAVAIGVMVDAAIVMIENSHKHLERRLELPPEDRPSRVESIVTACQEVGPALFFSLLVITVSFLPVFALEAQEGRLFRPLAYTKTFAMFFAAVLSVTLAPALMVAFLRGKVRPERRHPISRLLIAIYGPVVKLGLRWRWATVVMAIAAVALTVPVYRSLGSEFMPPLNEGTILYMPTAVPGMSIAQARQVMQTMNRILMQVPEVEHAFGKMGRAETATDSAPLSMNETVVTLKPRDLWRPGMTWERLIREELDPKLQFPGMPNIWWMPIQTRIEMLSTGIRSNLAIKVFGDDLDDIERVAVEIENTLSGYPGVASAFADRVTGGYFIDFDIDRDAIARYGLTVADVQMVIETAVGGKTITTTIEGRERYPVNVRYARDMRSDLEGLRRLLVSTPTGAQIPIGQLARIETRTGAPMIKSENGSLMGVVTVDVQGVPIGDFVAGARQHVLDTVELPPGTFITWAGQYEYLERVRERLTVMVPLTLALVFFLLYFHFKSLGRTLIVMLSVPFALVGAFWMLWLLEYNLSVAVWVGVIALAGVAAETGVIMIVYLDEAWSRRQQEASAAGRALERTDLVEAIVEGAVQRVRPKIMTVATTMLALLPIMWAETMGTGAGVTKRIAAPMIGGLVTSTILTLVVIPAIYYIWQRRQVLDRSGAG